MAKDKIKNLEIPVAENERNKAVENLLSLKEYFDNQLQSDQETHQAIAGEFGRVMEWADK